MDKINFNQNQTNKNAFTLLEMLIVITLVSILLSTVFAIILVVMRQQVRIYRIVETRRQGDAILNFMKEKIVRADIIRNSSGIQQCTSTSPDHTTNRGTEFVLEDNSIDYSFSLEDPTAPFSKLNYNEGGISTPLHNARVNVSNLNFSCLWTAANTTPNVQFSYTVEFNIPVNNDADDDNNEARTFLNYRSKVKLR